MDKFTYKEEIKDGISILLNEEIGNGEDIYQYSEIVYKDKTRYNLGKVVLSSPYYETPLGWFIWDQNYVYKCLEGYDKDVVELVFDLDNRCFIESKEKREELYDRFLEEKNITKKM